MGDDSTNKGEGTQAQVVPTGDATTQAQVVPTGDAAAQAHVVPTGDAATANKGGQTGDKGKSKHPGPPAVGAPAPTVEAHVEPVGGP